MKKLFLVLVSAVALQAVAGQPGKVNQTISAPISFTVLLDHDMNLLSSSYNDSIVWEVWIEPNPTIYLVKPYNERVIEKGIDQAFIEASKDAVAPLIAHNQGRTYFTYATATIGIHHIEAYNKYTNKLVGYTALVITRQAEIFYAGKKIPTDFLAKDMDNGTVWSPFTENIYPTPYKPGIQ